MYSYYKQVVSLALREQDVDRASLPGQTGRYRYSSLQREPGGLFEGFAKLILAGLRMRRVGETATKLRIASGASVMACFIATALSRAPSTPQRILENGAGVGTTSVFECA